MSKPFGDLPGVSTCSLFFGCEKNENIFDNGTPEGATTRYAIGGLIKTMPEVTLNVAPHLILIVLCQKLMLLI